MKNLLFITYCLFINCVAFGQTTIFNVAGGGTLPTNWVEINNDLDAPIDKGDYYLLEANTPGDIIETDIYDLSAYSSANFTVNVATFGNASTMNPAKIEISDDGGLTYSQVTTTFTPSSSTYIQGGIISINSLSNQVKIRISNNGTSGRGVRLQNLVLEAFVSTVSFDAATSTATEGNTILIPVTMSNYSSGPVILDVTLGVANTGNNTYELGDITLNTATLTFSGDGSQNISITINQDIDADDEVLEISISEQTSTGINIATALNTLTITDNEIPIAGDLVINEINYNPSDDDDPYEFIEIYNASGHHLNISGLTFTNGVTYTFPTGTTIDAAEYIIVARTAATYFGNGYPVYEYSGNLTNTGATITLKDGNNITIDEVIYGISSPWLTTPNGTGVSLSLYTTNQNTTDNDNASSWGASCAINGTPGSANLNCSAESEIVAVATSEATSISSLENTVSPLSATDGVQVWQFTINEGGSDLTDDDVLPSVINSLVITEKVGQDAVNNWTDALKSAAIFDGTTHLGTATIAQSSLTFSGSPLISIPDGTSKTLSLRISLNENIAETTIDNEDFVFQITDGNVTTPTDGTSSSFEFTTPQSTDGQNAIEVVGTALAFVTQPTNTIKDAAMTDIEIVATDANGNIDENFATNVSITSTGTLTGSPVSVTPVSGVATFSTLTHTTTGTGLTLTAAATGFTNIISSTFDITNLPDLFISEVSDASSFNNEFLEIYNNSSFDVDLTGYKLVMLPDVEVFDFGTDETSSGVGSELIIPANGFLVITRGALETNFQSEFSSFPNAAAFNRGHGNLYFGAGTARRWRLRANDGTANTDDGTLIDDTDVVVGGDASGYNRDYQNMPGNWMSSSSSLATPGQFDAGQVLPVELLNFTAIPNAQTVILNWTTATETNNAYFNIQHSTDGKNFETIGTKTGAGTTYEVQEYTFIDENLINGLNYYRLQQVDFDGKFENHKIVSVLITNKTTEIAIFPTPVSNLFDLVFNEMLDANTPLEIYNINGQLVKSEIINRNKNRQTINVTNLQAGIYFIRMNINNTMITKRFVKL